MIGEVAGATAQSAEPDELAASLAVHDELLARRGVEIWIGAEPTFTRTDSLEPAWTSAPSGEDKLARAHALACATWPPVPTRWP